MYRKYTSRPTRYLPFHIERQKYNEGTRPSAKIASARYAVILEQTETGKITLITRTNRSQTAVPGSLPTQKITRTAGGRRRAKS
jgi:hypothetical protein